MSFDRAGILPEPDLPIGADLLAEGRKAAETVTVGDCAFLRDRGVASELAWKTRCMAAGEVMTHAQIGFRDFAKTRRAFTEIPEALGKHGYRVDRYGICLDWAMGYPADARREDMMGTGLMMAGAEEFAALTADAPVAPHFGDFIMGMPAALENTKMALGAGSTSIGNLGQYFTYRLPGWDDDVMTTAETVKAMALAAAQPVDVLIHSNLDDGFAAQFSDLACSLGAVLLEQHVVEGLIGGRVSHCYGHTFTEPVGRIAFQRALADVSTTPGTMVYGNTVTYGPDEAANYASLAAYLSVDIQAQRTRPSGHAVNPVPVTEARRIPDVDEIIAAQMFANRLIERTEGQAGWVDEAAVDAVAARLVEGGGRFCEATLQGLAEAGIDTNDPFEMLLAVRRLGARRLEELYGPGLKDETQPRGRAPVEPATTFTELAAQAEACVASVGATVRGAIRGGALTGAVATTDVHEYGKMLVDTVLEQLDVTLADAGVNVDPEALAALARSGGADFVAVSTYNGVALEYVRRLRAELGRLGLDVPVFIGGRLNQVPKGSNTSMPVDVSGEIAGLGAIACANVEDMLVRLAEIANARDGARARA